MPERDEIQRKLQKIAAMLKSLEETLEGEELQQASVPLQAQKARLEALLTGAGAVAQGDAAQAVGQNAIGVGGGVSHSILSTAPVTIYTTPPGPQPLALPEALRRYLDNLIAAHQHLRLQGIRAGSQPLSVALEKVYVSLTAVEKGVHRTSNTWEGDMQTSGTLTIAEALARHRRLVIIGDPGCGKTTLLAYLALTYARARRAGDDMTTKRLYLTEGDHLPIFLPLRDLGRHLKETHPLPGKDGPALLLEFLQAYSLAQDIHLPAGFFGEPLESGKAVLLLDGMDEVAELSLRKRMARLIEKFAERYEKCRFVVTSRAMGYEGAARVGAGFGLAKVRDFSPAEVRQFIRDWTRAVETTLAQSENPEILHLADAQAEHLIQAVDGNPRVADLAVNPLLLTVIALVHRYRARLPERRSELYEEAVEVLLGHWDEAKGLESELPVAGLARKLDGGDRRSLLEPVAFWMHERSQREIELDELRPLLLPTFQNLCGATDLAAKSLDDFLRVISERSGLLVERGAGTYGFAHLTFQEYLAARALADRADALALTLKKLPDPWWREVILLQAGYLSNQGKRRVSELIRAILDADPKTEREPHHHLLLAAECLFDVGPARVEGDLLGEARRRLQKEADTPFEKGNRAAALAKIIASNALARIDSGQVVNQFWKLPFGEPEWLTIPAGIFWMGGEGMYYCTPVHRLHLPEYQISRVPVTNAQYALYVKDANINPPEHWRGGSIPPGRENHPVVNISWNEAMAYCKWLSEKIEKPVCLPSEAEWEKAARGDKDLRAYPWGDNWRELHCNSEELGLGETTPVGLFLNSASPFRVLDMSGNVWEWTRSLWGKYYLMPEYTYPYEPGNEYENLNAPQDVFRILRGGAFDNAQDLARCAFRRRYDPSSWYPYLGFRVVLSPITLS